MWFLAILAIGAVVAATRGGSPRARQPVLPPPPPGPIKVLGDYLQIGQAPPPPVILCAIAEAEALGRTQLASDIVRVFVEPVVRQHHGASLPVIDVPVIEAPVIDRGRPGDRGYAGPSSGDLTSQIVRLPGFAAAGVALDPSGEEIFEVRWLRGHAPPSLPAVVDGRRLRLLIDDQLAAAQAPPVPPQALVTSVPGQDGHDVADQTLALAAGSPIAGVSDDAWRVLVSRLSRESPRFASERHVGQYRQRRERLAELGIDADQMVGSALAQREALDVDLADAHGHAEAGGLLDEHLGTMIVVPGSEGSAVVTLSGVLGVIQCAGLDGAVGWLERFGDRKRYPHTTRAFLSTNGVF